MAVASTATAERSFNALMAIPPFGVCLELTAHSAACSLFHLLDWGKPPVQINLARSSGRRGASLRMRPRDYRNKLLQFVYQKQQLLVSTIANKGIHQHPTSSMDAAFMESVV
jgi:hypothetical protein